MKSKSLVWFVAGIFLLALCVSGVQAATYDFVTKFGSYGTGDGQFDGAYGICADPSGTNVYVVDTGNNRVERFTADAYSTQFGGFGSGNGQFSSPYGCHVDHLGNIFVVDAGNNRIQRFMSNLVHTDNYGVYGSGNGQFINPSQIAVNRLHTVFYVVDSGNNRVQKFAYNGVYQTQWGGLPAGSGNGQFNKPWGIAVDDNGYVYVTDFYNNRIQKFDSNGNYLTQWGSYGSGIGQFSSPYGIAVDDSNNVYVVDWNSRVQKFDSNGNYLTQWGSPGSGDGQLSAPVAAAADASGNVYVMDYGNSRVQKFAPGTTGDIDVSSSPSGAEIWIESTDTLYWNTGHVTPYTLTNVVPGSYKIKVKHAGYNDMEQTGVLVESAKTTVLPSFMLVPTPPVQTWAVTNIQGSIITIEFDKPMADPTGTQSQFFYNVNGGSNQQFSYATPDYLYNNEIHLMPSDLTIKNGDDVTVSYTAGTVTAADGGILQSFINYPVTNNVAPAPTFSSISPDNGPTAGSTQITIVGTNFVGGGLFDVKIDGNSVTSPAISDGGTKIIALTPSGTEGAKDVKIINDDGQFVTAGGAFTYVVAPSTGNIEVTTNPPGARVSIGYLYPEKVSPCTYTDLPAGEYGVTVYSAGYYMDSKQVHVTAGSETPVAFTLVSAGDFSADQTYGDAPLTVQFTEALTINPLSRDWVFSDEGVSDEQNPSHVYSEPRPALPYDVSLTVSAYVPAYGDGEVHWAVITHEGYITVTAPPTGSIHVTSFPTGAQVAIDYLLVDDFLTDDTVDEISPGPHTVTVWLDGYVPQTKSVIVVSPGTVDVDFTLAAVPPAPSSSGWKFHADAENTGVYIDTSGNYPMNNVKWSFPTGGLVRSSPTVVDNVAYVGSNDNKVYAIDVTTGLELWSVTTGNDVQSSPAVYNGVVYVGSLDNKVYARNAITGAEKWTFFPGYGGGVYSSPVVANGVVYVGTAIGNANVYAIDAVTGNKIWSKPFTDSILSSPAVANGMVYVGCMDHKVYALNANTGEIEWEYETLDAIQASPMVAFGRVFIGSGTDDKQIYALDAIDGHLDWTFLTSNLVASTPAVYGDWVLAGGYSNIYALDPATGSTVWTHPLGGNTYSSPSVANGRVYFGTTNNKVTALDANNGNEVWTATIGPVFYSSPAITDGVLYIGSDDGKVYALGGTPVPPGRDEAIDNGKTYLDPTKDKEELLVSDDDVSPGTPIKLINGEIKTSPADGSYWVEFINLAKNDNWGHPAKLIFHATGKPDVVYDVDFPPSEENIVKFLHEGGNVPNAEGRTGINIPADPDYACTPLNSGQSYAVLISGGGDSSQNYARYYNDIKFMYNTLRGPNYNIPAANIRVVMSDGMETTADKKTNTGTENSDPNLDGNTGTTETIQKATKTNVQDALSTAWNGHTLTSSDTLYIFTTAHGEKITTTTDNTNQVNLLLWGTEKITDSEFKTALPTSPKIYMMMEQCYAGGFKNDVILSSGSNRVLVTAARGDQASHSNDFSYYWITALAGKDSQNVLVNADVSPANGQVSMREAFTYANTLDPSGPNYANTETPYLFDYTSGIASSSFLTGCSETRKITVTVPTGTWNKGDKKTISWTTSPTTFSPQLKIELRNGTGYGTWQANINNGIAASAKSYEWTVVDTPGGARSDYFVEIHTITNAADLGVSGKSSTFSIAGVTSQPPGALLVTSSPVGAEIILRDASYNPVFINGVEQSGKKTTSTGYNFTPLISSLYYVKAALSCYQDVSFVQKQVNPSTTCQAPFTLVPVSGTCTNPGPSGSISISSLPQEGFRVWLKGDGSIPQFANFVDMGYETPVIQDVGVGQWWVKLTANGFKSSEEKLVPVNDGEVARADFVLEPDDTWYKFTGFDAPVDMNGVINSANAGKNIPLKWHLSDKNGYVSDPNKFIVKFDPIVCTTGATDTLEVYDPTAPSTLTYMGNGAWHYNWKTEKTLAGKCMNVYLQYENGEISSIAKFKFK
jgi:outer membrane protein assembly factor BamB/DNA-binding beta-propeller fold protein YncE